jgi:RNA polymerase sigma factor (sigma-70 family)
VIADPKSSTPYEQLENHANIEMIHQIFRDLDPREKLVLRYRFGLDGHNRKTLEEVGQKLGITREYVRQNQNRALKKLRYRIQLLETVRAVV